MTSPLLQHKTNKVNKKKTRGNFIKEKLYKEKLYNIRNAEPYNNHIIYIRRI